MVSPDGSLAAAVVYTKLGIQPEQVDKAVAEKVVTTTTPTLQQAQLIPAAVAAGDRRNRVVEAAAPAS